MSKTLADILRSYIPDGDGYNSEYAHNLNAAADALESQQSAPAGYVMVPVELMERIDECAICDGTDATISDDLFTQLVAALAAAPKSVQPPVQEPFGWYTEDHLTDKSATTYDKSVADRWRAKGWPVHPLYKTPQPVSDDARDALVEALEVLAKLGNGEHYGNSDGNVIAQRALTAYRAAMGSNGE